MERSCLRFKKLLRVKGLKSPHNFFFFANFVLLKLAGLFNIGDTIRTGREIQCLPYIRDVSNMELLCMVHLNI